MTDSTDAASLPSHYELARDLLQQGVAELYSQYDTYSQQLRIFSTSPVFRPLEVHNSRYIMGHLLLLVCSVKEITTQQHPRTIDPTNRHYCSAKSTESSRFRQLRKFSRIFQ